MTRGTNKKANMGKVKTVGKTLGLVGTISACLLWNAATYAASTEQATPRDTNSIGLTTLNASTMGQGQFKVSILGQFSQDQYKDADVNPESGQSKRNSSAFQADFGLWSALQVQLSVSGDDDKDIEIAENQDLTKRDFGYRGASLGIKGRILNHHLIRIAAIPYVSHVQAFKPDSLEKTQGRVENGINGAISVGDESLGGLNIFAGLHHRDPIAYRHIQIGRSYHVGAGIQIPLLNWLALGAHYQINGDRFASSPEILPDSVESPESRTLTSRLVGGGLKFDFSDIEIGLFGEHLVSGHEATLPNQNTFALHMAYSFGKTTKDSSKSGSTTIISDDKTKQPANAEAAVATETFPEAIDYNVQSADSSLDFDKELKRGAETQYEAVDSYKVQLDELHAAEEAAAANKAKESLANERSYHQELDSQYQATKGERAKIRKEIVDQGLEITPEDANWRGLED